MIWKREEPKKHSEVEQNTIETTENIKKENTGEGRNWQRQSSKQRKKKTREEERKKGEW